MGRAHVTSLASHAALGYVSRDERRLWGFDEAERKVLLASTDLLPSLASLLARAERHQQIEDLWIVWSTVNELDEVYSLVEALIDTTRSRKRRELLDGMIATLCTSMDGF